MEVKFNMRYINSNPVIDANSGIGMIALFVDTGASYPVWTKDISYLKYLNCRQVTKDNSVSINGFGWEQGATGYMIDIVLNSLVYSNLPILVKYLGNMPGQMLMSASMLNTLEYKFSTVAGKMYVNANHPESCTAMLTDINGIYYGILDCWRTWGVMLEKPIPIEETKLWKETYGDNSDLLPDII